MTDGSQVEATASPAGRGASEPPDASLGGPVSAALLTEVGLEVRRHGIVVWLDRDSHYVDLVDRLIDARASGQVPYEVAAFRGSHLELMLALAPHAAGTDKSSLLLHMPRFNEESMRETPMLELYLAGVRYRKALDTLVSEAAAGHARPEQLAAFLAEGDLTLEKADAWLTQVMSADEGGLAAQLEALPLLTLVDDLATGRYVAQKVAADWSCADVVWLHLAKKTGMTESWRERVLDAGPQRARDIAYAAASWALGVEYVHDLRRPPYSEVLSDMTGLAKPLVETCHELAEQLREHQADFYQRTADQTETTIDDDVVKATAADLGHIDTFRFEEETILEAALADLGAKRWEQAAEYAVARLEGASFWIQRDPARRSAWQLVASAAALGKAIAGSPAKLSDCQSLEQAVDDYVARGASVDQAHRRLEQQRSALLYSQVPEFEKLRTHLDALRVLWREWADTWAVGFNALCRRVGFLPGGSLQQRTLFDQEVRPLASPSSPTAYFVIDAFRYELADELRQGLEGTPATSVHLKARLAELPTITAVGMNVLAPVAVDGHLSPVVDGHAIRGFGTGEFQVLNPETRQRAMRERVGGATCPWFSLHDVLSRDATGLKRSIARAHLVVVHVTELDDAGEKGLLTSQLDPVMQHLRAAWRLLRDAGVKQFVMTADHGFLLLDETAKESQKHGRKIDPKRRHVISTVAADHSGEVRVPLKELGYDGVDGLHAMFPETTAVFDRGKRGSRFVHGGNSLQERVIPVLRIVHRSATGGDTLSYVIEAQALEGVAGMHCAKVEVNESQGALEFGRQAELELGLRVAGAEGVTVELCQTRADARLRGGTIWAKIGTAFEVFFRLRGSTDERVRVEVYHPSRTSEVEPCVIDGRFAVSGGGAAEPALPANVVEGVDVDEPVERAWLEDMSPGVRPLFAHLAEHGSIGEAEAIEMLGGPRKMRRFSLSFEQHAQRAPFGVRVESLGGVKRYVREGGSR